MLRTVPREPFAVIAVDIDKLNQIISKLNNGQPTKAACGDLGSFINQVNGFVPGTLTSDQAQPLIDAANAIKTKIGC